MHVFPGPRYLVSQHWARMRVSNENDNDTELRTKHKVSMQRCGFCDCFSSFCVFGCHTNLFKSKFHLRLIQVLVAVDYG